MYLLAVETSGPTGSLALAQVDGTRLQKLHETAWIKRAMHSEIATVELRKILMDAGTEFKALTHLCVNCGPGSFTGLRVGINMVKSLAYALQLPVAPLNTLETLAFANATVGENIFVATKAVQNFFYCAAYTRTEASLDCTLRPRSAEEPELNELAKHSAKVLIEGQSSGFTTLTSAKDLLPLVIKLQPARAFITWDRIFPLYIRGSEAEEKLKKKGLLF